MLIDLHPTVRKYPRTLNEAFPNSKDTANWLEHHVRPIDFKNAALILFGLMMMFGIVAICKGVLK